MEKILFIEPFDRCPCCQNFIENYGKHHCEIWINGMPAQGANHWKDVLEITERERRII